MEQLTELHGITILFHILVCQVIILNYSTNCEIGKYVRTTLPCAFLEILILT